MKEQVYLYPVWVRLWHLFNLILILTLIFTGLCLQYSSEDYTIIPFKYAVSIHNIAGFILIANYLFFIFGNLLTPNGRYYQFHRAGMINRVLRQFKYYSFGIFKKENAPFPIDIERKFNPLQKLSYVSVHANYYYRRGFVILSGYYSVKVDRFKRNTNNRSGSHHYRIRDFYFYDDSYLFLYYW